MLTRSLPRFAPLVASTVVLLAGAAASCGGPGASAVSATLSPGKGEASLGKRAAFGVVFAGPRGEVVDLTEPAVTVLFNRPMRDFDSPDNEGVPPVRCTTEAGEIVAGAWRWIGTHGLLFTPDHPLPGSTRFHVSVPPGTRSLEGETMTAEYAFDLSTPRPKVVDAAPADGASTVQPDATFRLKFNQPMAPAAVERSAHLSVRTGTSGAAKAVPVKAAHPKAGPDKDVTVILTPAAQLPTDSAVELVLDAGLQGEGPLASTSARTAKFRTYGPIAIERITCPRVTGPRCEAHRFFTVVLSNAVDPDDFAAHLKAPGLKMVHEAKTATATKKRPRPTSSLLVQADPDFGQRYHMTVTKGLRDVFGQHLDHNLSFDLDTEAPWREAGKVVTHPTAQPGGSSDGDRPEARPNESVPHRPRLEYGVELGVAGHVVEALANAGTKSHLVPVSNVNVPTYGLFEQKLSEDETLAWLHGPSTKAPSGAPWRWSWVSPGVPENVRDVRKVDLDRLLGGPAGRGAALLAVYGQEDDSPRAQLLTVTDLGVSAEVSRFGTLVWVTHLSNGQPVAGAEVSLRGLAKGDAFTTTTDTSGLAEIPPGDWVKVREDRRAEHPYFFVKAGSDWTYAKVERARASYDTGVDVDVAAEADWAGMVYPDRGVYRPGETVKLGGIFRKVDATGVTVVPDQEARVIVEDSQGEKVFDGKTKLGTFGELAMDLPLSKTSHLGSATVKVEVGRKQSQTFAREVLLAAYKASEFKVGVDPSQTSYVRGDDASFAVQADYLFGAPMGGAQVRSDVRHVPTSFSPPGSEGFTTDDTAFLRGRHETSPYADVLKDDSRTLDPTGHATFEVSLALPHMQGPEEVVMEAEVTDISQATISNRTSVRVHPAQFYVGIGELASRFLAAGAEVPVKVVAFDPKGAHVAGVQAKIELVKRTWVSATLDEAAAVPRQAAHLEEEVVATCETRTTAEAASCKVRVPSPGSFVIHATARDARGNPTSSSTLLYAMSDRGDEAVSWTPPASSHRLVLETDRKVYGAGDTAKILVQNPFKKAEALVTVERGGVLFRKVVQLEGPMPVVDVEVKSSYFPNAFISVRLVRGRVAEPPASGADVGSPDFRLGIVPIAVDPKTHRLTATISTSKKEYRPGDELDADVAVRGSDGKPGSGEVTFYAVDEGVLMLTSYETPDPLPAFSASRRLAVFAVESREDLARMLPMQNGERVKLLGFDYLSPPGGDKGGDGGGGGDAARMDFKTTAFFDAGKVTDAEGHVRYHFKLPDNLTTFRLMAIVAGADDRFGAGEAAVTTSKRLMARPVMPRIVRVGDRFEAGVVVSSKGLPATTAHVTMLTKGVDVAGPAARDVQVPAGGNVEVRFPLLAAAPGQATFTFAVGAGDEKDTVVVSRPVDLPVATETVSAYGETTRGVSIGLGDLSQARPDRGGLDVRLASTALVGLGSSFDRLIEYPYGCTEQLTSRILPLLVLPELARSVGAHLPARIPDVIDDGIGKLLEHQDEGGGFSFWGDGARPEPWLSAYAMLAIDGAARQGMFVPKDARDRGTTYLRQILDRSTPAEEADPGHDDEQAKDESDSDDPLHARSPQERRARSYAEMVFVADTLATLGEVDPGSLGRLFEARARRPLFTQALLLHGVVAAHLPASEIDTLATEIAARVRIDGADAYADEPAEGFDDFLDSATRTSALVLRGLVAARPDHPLAARLAHGLLAKREGGAWRSTQENVWALLALDDYRRAQELSQPSFDARVLLGGSKVGEARFHGGSWTDQPVTVEMKDLLTHAGGPLALEVSGKGKLYYSADLTTVTSTLPVKARDSGMSVKKVLRALGPGELAAAQKVLPQHGVSGAALGDLVLVDLLLESAEPREQVVVDDPLPSGLEPIDFALDTSAQGERVTDDGPHGGPHRKALFQYGVAFGTPTRTHREQHDDRVLTFLSHIDPGIYHFRYLARATTPGDFVVPPTRAACMYSPEVSGASAATRFVVGTSTGATSGPVASAR